MKFIIQKIYVYLSAIKQSLANPPILKSLIAHKILGSSFKKLTWFKNLSPEIIIDVGANTGQTAKEFRNIFPKAKIFSFEPIPECFLKLNQNMEGDRLFKSYCVALGEKTGKANFNLNSFSASSSLLEISSLGKKLYPQTKDTVITTVNIDKLDNYKIFNKSQATCIIKIDVQGFEDKIIRGGAKTIKKCQVAIIETSFRPIYKNQPLFSDIYKLMDKLGFLFYGFTESYLDPKDGSLVFADSIYVSKKFTNQKRLVYKKIN